MLGKSSTPCLIRESQYPDKLIFPSHRMLIHLAFRITGKKIAILGWAFKKDTGDSESEMR